MSHLISKPDRAIVLSPQYFGSVRYYAAMSAYPVAAIDLGERYDKRHKAVHRCEIVDTQGRLTLTVPVAKPSGAHTWSEAMVSSHGGWWSDHVISLESAYGRTPFFEFYFDRFRPWLRDSGLPVTALDSALDQEVRQILGLETEVVWGIDAIPEGMAIDERRRDAFAEIMDVPYYQVRANKLGFHGGLSILDLLFNMGPEAPLVLKKMQGVSA